MPRNSNKLDKHACEHCNRVFHSEKNLFNHSCEKKRRWFSQDEPHVRLAFMAWTRFYELNSRLRKDGARKSFKEFINSKYYLAFVRFGKHMVDLNAITPASFIDYVIKNNLPVDKWTHDIVYERYLKQYLINETPEQALSRTIEVMKDWSINNDEEWKDFFRKISPTLAAAWVKSGKISPWVLYNADSADALLDRCGQEQISMISSAAKPSQWKIKFIKDRDSSEWIRTTLRQAGV